MRLRVLGAASALLATVATGCAGDDAEPADDAAATPDQTPAEPVSPETLFVRASDLPDGFQETDLVEGQVFSETPPECPQFSALDPVGDLATGVVYLRRDVSGLEQVETRVGPAEMTDAVLEGLRDVAACADVAFTDSQGDELDVGFAAIDLPAGTGMAMRGTIDGVPIDARFAGFEAGGHFVALSVINAGEIERPTVELAELVELTLERVPDTQ